MNRRVEFTVGTVWVALSLTAIIAGSVGPWVAIGPLSVSGTSGDGWIALAAGVVGVLAVLAPRIPAFVALAAAVIAAAVASYDIAAILSAEETFFGSLAPGWGVVAVLLGAVSLAVWALLQETARAKWLLSAVSAASIVILAGASVCRRVERLGRHARRGRGTLNHRRRSPAGTRTRARTASRARTRSGVRTRRISTAGRGRGGLVLTGADGLTVRVTVRHVRDPLASSGEFDSVPAGKRMVGVDLRLTNQSVSTTYDDSPSNGANLIYGNDRQADAALSFGDCEAQSLTIAPGDSRRVCIPFEVSATSTVKKLQFALDSGFSDDSGEWMITRGTSSSSPAGTSSGAESEPLKSCDQNIRAGPKTTCGFADAIFIEYARLLQAGQTQDTVSLRATSPADGRTYSVTCEVTEDEDVQCQAGDAAYVRFPQHAASVY